MLIWTIFCLIGLITSGLFAYRKKKTTLNYIAKLIFFIFLFAFLFLLIGSALHSAPPVFREPMIAS